MMRLPVRSPARLVARLAVVCVVGCGGESAMDRNGAPFPGLGAGADSAAAGESNGGSSGMPGAGGATSLAGSGAGTGGGLVGCGTVVNDLPLLTPVILSGSPPDPAGGTLVAGTYVLSSLTYYLNGATCTPPSLKTSDIFIVHPSSASEGAIEEDTNQTSTGVNIKDSRTTFTYKAADNGLMLDFDCVSALTAFSRNAAVPVGYSATAAEIRTFGPKSSCGVSVSVFSRR